MIRIMLSEKQKNDIISTFIEYINSNKVKDKLSDLVNVLKDCDYKKTSELLGEKINTESYFTTYGKGDFNKIVTEFNEAIKIDSKEDLKKKKEINYLMCNGKEKGKDTRLCKGFGDIYADFSGCKKTYDALDILNIINVNVCPYCNRQYTFTARKDKSISRPQFDHFYPKSKYPYLAICIFNLIPSCSLCNQGKTDEDINNFLYPYEESFEDMNIHFEVSNVTKVILQKANFKINLEPKDDYEDLINQYNKCFKIGPLYNQHNQYVKDLVLKHHIFNDDAISSIYDSYSEFFQDEGEVKNLLLGTCEINDYTQHPLSKLTNDVLKQLYNE